MIEHIQYFKKGTVYRIRNRKTKKDLTLSSKLQVKMEKPQQIAEQLWIINEIKNDEYEIVQLKTGTVLTQKESKKNFNTKIDKRRMTDNQLWNFLFAEKIHDVNYFWIKPCDYEDKWFCASSMDNHIRITLIDFTLNVCLWHFIPCEPKEDLLKKLSFIRSESTNLVLEVPDYASKEGASIVQYLYSGGGNQRWVFQPYQDQELHKEYCIRNYSSGLSLTAVYTKNSFKVTQTVFSCSPDQRWKFIFLKDQTYLIQSVANNEYYLGCNNDRGGSPVSLVQDKLKGHWVVEGCPPPKVAEKV